MFCDSVRGGGGAAGALSPGQVDGGLTFPSQRKDQPGRKPLVSLAQGLVWNDQQVWNVQ